MEIGRDKEQKKERWRKREKENEGETERCSKMKVRVFCKQPWE